MTTDNPTDHPMEDSVPLTSSGNLSDTSFGKESDYKPDLNPFPDPVGRDRTQSHDCVQLLSVDLLEQNRGLVKKLKELANLLGLEFGWHYLLDLTWTINQLRHALHCEHFQGKRIIDAGAGTGILQWYLAEEGAHVISVDRLSRALLPLRFRKRYKVKGLRPKDLETTSRLIQMDMQGKGRSDKPISTKARLSHVKDDMINLITPKAVIKKPLETGSVTIYNQDLAHLEDIPDASIDGVVSISALEHNTPEGLDTVIKELLRVLKPGSPLIATLCATQYQDTWHTPSRGWLYTVRSLGEHFGLPETAIKNEADYEPLFVAIRNCSELRDHLARFYFTSGENGMPWGIWDPQYLPVGIVKTR